MSEPRTFKVFLADDHPLLRTGLRMSLSRFDDIDFIGDASDGFKAVEKIKQNPPDVGSPEQLFSSRSQARLMLCDNKSATMATARCVANSDI